MSQPVLVALDTDQDVIYAPASGWDKICLLWTFRNFHSLPQNVLSPRQRQLIASLYRKASDYPSNEFHQAAIVGTVEGFRPLSLPTLAAPARTRNSVAEDSPRKSASVSGRKPFYARFAFSVMTFKIATALLVIAIAVLAWHQLGAQPVADSRLPQTVAAVRADDVFPNNEHSTSANVAAVNGNLQNTTAHVGTAAPAVQRSAAPPAESAVKPSSVSNKPDQSDASAHPQGANVGGASSPVLTRPTGKDGRERPSSITSPAPIVEAMADQPRMQISGRPRKLVYPVCPETRARGQVSLQAVVGSDGAVNRVRVLTGNHTLAAAAIQAVRQWRYEPFSGAGPTLERETNITISFISNEVVAVSFLASTPLSR